MLARRATGGWVPTKLGMAWWRGLGKTRLGSSFFWEVLRRNPGRMTVLCLIGIQTVFGESNGPNVKQIEQPSDHSIMGDGPTRCTACASTTFWRCSQRWLPLQIGAQCGSRLHSTHVLMSKVYTVCALFWRPPDPHSLTALAQHDWEGALGSCRCEAQRCCSV